MIAEHTVHQAHTIDLRVSDEPWPFAIAHAMDIEAYWLESCARNPHLFNGGVFVLREHSLEAGHLRGQYVPADFASYLYWRDHEIQDQLTCDGFASIFLRSRQGGYFLAEAAEHTLNGGLYVPPGGLLDAQDVMASGDVDISSYVLRELAEETGLNRQEIVLEDTYLVVRIGWTVAVAVQARCTLEDDEVISRVNAYNKQQAEPELGHCLWYNADQKDQVLRMPETTDLLMNYVMQMT